VKLWERSSNNLRISTIN